MGMGKGMKIEYMKVPVRNKTLTIVHRCDKDDGWQTEVVLEDATTHKFCADCIIKDKLKKIYGNNITIEELLYG